MRHRPRRLGPRILAGLLGTAGLALTLQGAWIPVKAQVAQVLLRDAWARTAAGDASEGNAVKPWSWADTWPVARLVVPAHGADLVVLEGAQGAVLAFGPGRMTASARPGLGGHVVLGGHRDTHFAFLEDVAAGDALELHWPGGAATYRVVGAELVHFRDTRILDSEPGADRLTLVTCWPFDAVGQGPWRWAVTAERVGSSRDA